VREQLESAKGDGIAIGRLSGDILAAELKARTDALQAEQRELQEAKRKHEKNANEAIENLDAEIASLRAERDAAVRQIPTERPDGNGRLLLNAYGRMCYDAGAEALLASARPYLQQMMQEMTSKADDYERASAHEYAEVVRELRHFASGLSAFL
jgi:hypothetical protein